MPINYVKKFLSNQDLYELKDVITKIETQTSGELRMCLKLKRQYNEKKLSTKKIAVKEFMKLGMHKTKDKTGVLVFVLFEEKVFEIIADEGINSKINQDKWEIITFQMKTEFSNKNYKTGLLKCLDEIGKVLIEEFPIKPGDKNELPDDIITE
jgi:uncharacterized membrane protein